MPSNKPGSRMIKAAGGVAWRPGSDGKPEILLVHRKKYDDWSLPKGKTEPGESLPVTAVREVLEEGGAQLALGRRLPSVRYSVGGRPKRVHYWVARVLSVDAHAVPNAEVDEVAWLPADRAVGKVSYTHDHGVLADFAARPAGTVPLILLRHAKALDKHGWKRPDAVRPLADSGRADAKALADLLACFAPRPRLISSTALRCTETLRPLSRLTGVPVREEPSLYIHNKPSGTDAADPAAELAALVREVIAAGECAVICAHRENIPALREAALAALAGHPGNPGEPDAGTGNAGTADAADQEPDGAGAGLPGLSELPKDWDDPLPTGGFWVLNIAARPAAPEPAGGGEPGESRRSAPSPAAPAAVPGSSESAPSSSVPAESGSAASGASVSGPSVSGPSVSGPSVSGPSDSGPSASAKPAAAPARRWWQRLLGRRRVAAIATTADQAADDGVSAARVSADRVSADRVPAGRVAADRVPADRVPADPDGAGRTSADGPVGVLISADRYDLSES